MRLIRYFLKKYWFLAIAVVMVILFLGFVRRTDSLNLYINNKGTSVYTIETESETEIHEKTDLYKNQTLSISMQIPKGWQYVKQNGYDTYIHKESSSSLQIQLLDYYPQINNISTENIAEACSAKNQTLVDFAYTGSNGYYVISQANGMDGVTDYLEQVYWDRAHVVKIVAVFNDGNYEKLKDLILYCIDSFSWEYEDPIPEGFYINYQLAGDFEYLVPLDWPTGTTDNTFYAYNESYGANFSVSLLEDSSSISDISQIDYSNFLSSGKTNFALTAFEQSEDAIYAEATYLNGSQQIGVIQYYKANGRYHYVVTYEFPIDIGNEAISLFKSALQQTRIFYTLSDEDIQNLEKETETETSQSFSPDFSLKDTFPDSPGSSDEDVSTFADALVSVANISKEKAENISEIWNACQVGRAVYAKAIKESDSSFVLQIETDSQNNYYLFLYKTGDLQEIRSNSEDGPTIWSY